jgi:hypothetical protein
MGHAGFGGGFSHAAVFHPSGVGARTAIVQPGGFATRTGIVQPGGVGRTAVVQPMGVNAGRFAFAHHHRFASRHRFPGNRFAFIGGAYPYGYDDDCYSRVWTPWGWRWQNVCY